MIEELINCDCIQIGNFTLKNGELSKYYFDMRLIVSKPELLKKIGDALYKLMGEFDIICGIPYGALPVATYISVAYNKPMIYTRDKPKNYGMRNQIEGKYKKTDRCVLLDDVITSGGSMKSAFDILKDNVNVVKCIVILDRQQNNMCELPVQSLFTKTDIVKYRLNKIRKDKQSKLCFSADLIEFPKLWDIIDRIGDRIVICKIHYDIVPEKYREEFKIIMIDKSIKHNFLIMEDRKFNDISYIVQKQYKLFENWVDLVTVHGLVTNEVIESLSGVVIVANMSNNIYDFSNEVLSLAYKNKTNVIGFVSQERIDTSFINMTPGISMSISKIGDQNYRNIKDVDTDILIIGRAIYNCDGDPRIPNI